MLSHLYLLPYRTFGLSTSCPAAFIINTVKLNFPDFHLRFSFQSAKSAFRQSLPTPVKPSRSHGFTSNLAFGLVLKPLPALHARCFALLPAQFPPLLFCSYGGQTAFHSIQPASVSTRSATSGFMPGIGFASQPRILSAQLCFRSALHRTGYLSFHCLHLYPEIIFSILAASP
jgi:hypothetical protein